MSLPSPVTNPYRGLPATSFWKSAVAGTALGDLDPVVEPPFQILKSDRVATAGSCFAQHISKALIREGVHFVKAEAADEAEARDLPVYSARYGNIYTCRQLRQLFERAYGLVAPRSSAWRRADGRFVDPFRPNEHPAGFASPAEVEAARDTHLAAVREVLEGCDVFVFTLGLTEAWLCEADGMAVPLPPGVVAAPTETGETFSPKNLSVEEMTGDLQAFIDDVRLVNPRVRFVLTVSPVPLIATFERRHVLVSNTFSKAALRVVADAVTRRRRDVLYFPSYEMIVAHPRACWFEDDLRAVKPEGVAAVMAVFRRRMLSAREAPQSLDLPESLALPESRVPPALAGEIAADPSLLESEFKAVVCDEEMLAR